MIGPVSASHRVAVVTTVVALWALLRLLAIVPLVEQSNDIPLYFDLATAVLEGEGPYAHRPLEYPAGILIAVVPPRLLAQDVDVYAYSFAAWMLCFDAACALLVAALAGATGRDPDQRLRRAAGAALVYTGLVALLGEIPFQRYDLVPSAIVAAALVAAARDRRLVACALLALGAFVKVYPALLLPVVLATTAGGSPGRARRALTGAGVFVVVLATLHTPLLAAYGSDALAWVGAQAGRGLQVESTWAAILLAIGHLTERPVDVVFVDGAMHLAGAGADALAHASSIALLVAWVAVTVLALRAPRDAPGAHGELAAALSLAASVIVLVVLVVGKVLSPQFFVWLAPLAAIVVAVGGIPRGFAAWCGGAFLATGFLVTHVKLPFIGEDPAGTWILVGRAAALAVAGWLLLTAMVKPALPPPPSSHGTFERAWLITRPAAIIALVAAFVVRDVSSSDFWFHWRVGGDILSERTVPLVDTYSATAHGAPYIVHGWLSAVLLRAADAAAGAAGVVALRLASVLAIVGLLLGAFPRRRARDWYVLPLLVAFLIAVDQRIEDRPHLIALVPTAAFGLVVARFRRDGRALRLVALPFIVALWTNLHGSALLAPALLGVLACGELVLPARRRYVLPRVSRDAAALGLASIACLAASACNPYGLDLFRFSSGMLFGAPLMRELVGEWMTALQAYDPATTVAHALLVGLFALQLALRWRRPLLAGDLAIGAVLGWLSFSTVRFVADALVIMLPTIAFGLSRLSRAYAPALRLSGAREAALVVVCSCFAVYAHRDEVGLSYSSRYPWAEAEHLRGAGLSGCVFADYEDGAFFLAQLPPSLRPAVDGRIDVLGEARMREYVDAHHDAPSLFAYLDRHGCTAAVLERRPKNRVPYAALSGSTAWRKVMDGPRRVVFERLPNDDTGP